MKKAVSLILVCTMLFAGLVFAPVFADAAEGASPVESRTLDLMKKELWDGGDGVFSISQRKNAGNNILSVSADPDASKLSFSSDFDPLDLSDFFEIALKISVRGDAQSYSVTVNLGSLQKRTPYKLTVTEDTEYIYVPLPADISDKLSHISLTLDAGDEDISYMHIFDISADNDYTYAYLSSFNATTVTPDCPAQRSEKGVVITPNENTASVEVAFVGTEDIDRDREVLVWLKVDSSVSGTVMLSCQYETESEEQDSAAKEEDQSFTVDTPPRSMSVSKTFFFTVKGGFSKATFSFASLTPETDLSLIGAGFADMGTADNGVGSITSCRYAEGKISLSGSLSNNASVEYYGSKLLLFAIHMKDALTYDISKLKPVATTSFSTRFQLSCEMDDRYGEYYYLAALDTDDGYIPVGSICCAASVGTSLTVTSSVSTLHGADAADVFDTNVSGVILDVCAGRLLDVDDIYSAEPYNYAGTYYFNREYLAELDNDIRFFESSGVQVYLRIYSDRDGYVFDYSPDDPDSLALMTAVSGFLSQRYTGMAGYIIGSPLNSDINSASPEYAERKARMISAFSEGIKRNDPSASVFLPFSTEEKSDPYLSAAMLQYYLSEYAVGQTAMLYVSNSAEDDFVKKAAQLSSLSSLFSSSSDGAAVLWNVPASSTHEQITRIYRNICETAVAQGLRFAAVSLAKTDKSRQLFSEMKEMLDSENVITAAISQYSATEPPKDYSPSAFSIWDFTSSYDTAGWVAGGCFSMPVTAKGANKTRVLQTVSDGSGDSAGILIGKTSVSVDMTGTVARITLAVLSDEADSADISILFGSGEARAQFSSKIECNKQISLLCDMSEYRGASKIDYTAVIVRGVNDAQAEISKIELCSDSLSEEELAKRYVLPDEAVHNPLLYGMIITIAAATVAIFSLLLRKKKNGTKNDK